LDALGARRRLLVFARRRLRQHGCEELVEHAAPAKEDAKRLIEDERVLVALHQNRVQRPIEIFARPDTRGLDRGERIHDRSGPDRNAGRAQRAGEVDDVFGETAGLRVCSFRGCFHSSGSLRRPQLSAHLVDQLLHLAAFDPRDVVLILEQYAERVGGG